MMEVDVPFRTCCPRSRGCGRQERILPHCHSLIPGMINPHGLTNDAMILLDTMDLQNRRMVYSEVAQHHWRQEGKHHGRGRRGCRALIAGEVPLMIAERAPQTPPRHPCHQWELKLTESSRGKSPLGTRHFLPYTRSMYYML